MFPQVADRSFHIVVQQRLADQLDIPCADRVQHLAVDVGLIAHDIFALACTAVENDRISPIHAVPQQIQAG